MTTILFVFSESHQWKNLKRCCWASNNWIIEIIKGIEIIKNILVSFFPSTSHSATFSLWRSLTTKRYQFFSVGTLILQKTPKKLMFLNVQTHCSSTIPTSLPLQLSQSALIIYWRNTFHNRNQICFACDTWQGEKAGNVIVNYRRLLSNSQFSRTPWW